MSYKTNKLIILEQATLEEIIDSDNEIISGIKNNYLNNIQNLLYIYKQVPTLNNLMDIISYYIIIENNLELANEYINKIDYENNSYILFLLSYYYIFIKRDDIKMIYYGNKSINLGSLKICYYLGYHFFIRKNDVKKAINYLDQNKNDLQCLLYTMNIYTAINNITLLDKYTNKLLNYPIDTIESIADGLYVNHVNDLLMIKIYNRIILEKKSITALEKLGTYYETCNDYENMIKLYQKNIKINELKDLCINKLINYYYKNNNEKKLNEYSKIDFDTNNNKYMYLILKYYLKQNNNNDKITKYLKLAIEKEDILSCFEAGFYYYEKFDFINSNIYFKISANKNHLQSKVYLMSIGCEDYPIDINILKKAANSNILIAMMILYSLLIHNNNKEANIYLSMAQKLDPRINESFILNSRLIINDNKIICFTSDYKFEEYKNKKKEQEIQDKIISENEFIEKQNKQKKIQEECEIQEKILIIKQEQ